MSLWQGIPILSLRQESPLSLCGLPECGKISLLIAVAVRVRGVPFYPFKTDRKGGNVQKVTSGQCGSEVDGNGDKLLLPSVLRFWRWVWWSISNTYFTMG